MLFALLLALIIDPASPASANETPAAITETAAPAAEPRPPLVLPAPSAKDEPSSAVRFLWRDHPSIRQGRNFRADFFFRALLRDIDIGGEGRSAEETIVDLDHAMLLHA